MVDNRLYVRSTNTKARYYMNFFTNSTDAATAFASELKTLTADTTVLISLHFGTEYKPYPTEEELAIPQALIEVGADIIIGGHSHTPRPIFWHEGENHSGIILTSLGNFYTPHKNSYLYLDAGTIVHLKLKPKKIYEFSYIPTFTYFFDRNGLRSRVLPIKQNPKESLPKSKEKESYLFSERDKKNLQDAYDIVHKFYSPLISITKGQNRKS